MAITQQQSAFVSQTSVSINLSSMLTVTPGGTNPAYLVLTALDRNEYTAGASGATGSFSGNGNTLALTATGGDAREAGIVFAYQASTSRYYNSTYGYLDQLTYTSSSSAGDVTNLSLFGVSSLSQAATDAYTMMQSNTASYLGSATVVTQSTFTGSVPAQATPNSIAAIADSFVGKAWNMDGCWVLASTIAADAGTSLPVQSTLIGLPGQSNGEWIVAFNGPTGQSGNWQAMVTAGEMVVIGNPGGGGHITTCVSGSGATAKLVDNATFESGSGAIQNAANDGSSNDIIVAAPHLASQEWSGVQASSVVIYELDTPIVTATIASSKIAFLASQALGSLFTAADPGNRPITQWQIYDTAASDGLVLNGVAYQDHSAASALTASSLAAVSLLAGSTATSDTVEVRAYNGSYWGDWASMVETVSPSATPTPTISPPQLTAQTAAQIWLGGNTIRLALPASTFADPQGQTLTYTAKLSSGQTLPSWLSFNPVTETFGGLAPTLAQTLNIVVRATDTSGLSAIDAFTATVLGTPSLTVPTANQTWSAGATVSLTLAANTFTDPQGQTLVYAATQSNGQALPSWLVFNATTRTFSGTAPATAQNLGIEVTATDSSGLSSSETFSAQVQSPTPVIRPGIAVTAQTPNQTWTDGQQVNFVLPNNTFTDALGLKMMFLAYDISGPDVTSWLHFRQDTLDFYGTVPATASGTAQIEVIAIDSRFMNASELFSVNLAAATGRTAASTHAISLAAATVPDPVPKGALLAFHA